MCSKVIVRSARKGVSTHIEVSVDVVLSIIYLPDWYVVKISLCSAVRYPTNFGCYKAKMQKSMVPTPGLSSHKLVPGALSGYEYAKMGS